MHARQQLRIETPALAVKLSSFNNALPSFPPPLLP